MRCLLIGLMASFVMSPAGWAQSPAGTADEPGIATGNVLQAHRSQSSISIDGLLDEPAWQQAEIATGFLQFEPEEGTPASQRSEVRVLYGPNSVYIGAHLYDEEPDRIQRTLGRRDDLNQADWFLVSIDSYFDKRTAYTFGVNAAGVQLDALRAGGGGPGGGQGEGGPGQQEGDLSWNAIWDSDVRVTQDGWIAEMQIPYSMLRFSRADVQTWGVQFKRRIPRLAEQSEWPLVPRTQRSNLVAQYGLLQGIAGISPRRNIQITPYTVSRLQTGEHDERPGDLASTRSLDVGGDLKVGIGSGITLDATINPDFGQVESDPAELNLTAFETFFEEQRPFFVEGTQIYEFPTGPGGLLYTRRIGAAAPIIGAAKLSGRTESGLSFGVLGASTGDDFSPEQHFGVVRLDQQIGSFSSAGGILTGFDATENQPGRRSFSGGLDWDLRFLGNRYSLNGFTAVTHRRGLGDGRSPETGFAGLMRAARREGAWTYDVGMDVFHHQFDPNDVGQLRNSNFVTLLAGIEHEINAGRPFGPFLRANFEIGGFQKWAYRDMLDLGLERLQFNSDWTLRSFQSIEFMMMGNNVFGGYDLFQTRGLGPRAEPRSLQIGVEFNTDERRNWQLGPELSTILYDDGGRTYTAGLRGEWNPGSRLSFFMMAEAEFENGVIDWSSNEAFLRNESGWFIGEEAGSGPGAYEPFGDSDDFSAIDALFANVTPFGSPGQYFVPIFGARDTRALDFTLRSTFTFTPDLSLQLYTQLFAARGRYQDFLLLQDRDTHLPFEDYPKRNDFSLSSFQANTVLRWEYRPGSTLFLVWTQGRSADEELFDLDLGERTSPFDTSTGDQIGDTFRVFPENVFLVKLNYTFLY